MVDLFVYMLLLGLLAALLVLVLWDVVPAWLRRGRSAGWPQFIARVTLLILLIVGLGLLTGLASSLLERTEPHPAGRLGRPT